MTELNTDHGYSMQPYQPSLDHGIKPGYTLVLDNFDFHIKVRKMTKEHQNTLKHYVNVILAKDRINFEHPRIDQPRALCIVLHCQTLNLSPLDIILMVM